MSPRGCRHIPLRNQPLVLVLGQVRMTPVPLAVYLPEIQEDFRRHGYPIERAGKVQQLVVSPTGVSVTEQQRWEYRSIDERWSITLFADSIVVQTTTYPGFEAFAEQLQRAVNTVIDRTEQKQFGRILRLGLRYIDVVRPRPGEDFRAYLRPGFHGLADEVFRPETHRLHVESVGRTDVREGEAIMVVRVTQNDQGYDLPPDLVAGAPQQESTVSEGKLVTLIDLDHFLEGNFEPNVDWLLETFHEMHDIIIETFHNHVVSEHALEVWR